MITFLRKADARHIYKLALKFMAKANKKQPKYPIAPPCFDYGDPFKIPRDQLLNSKAAKLLLGWSRERFHQYVRRGVVVNGQRVLFPVLRMPQPLWTMDAARAFLHTINGR